MKEKLKRCSDFEIQANEQREINRLISLHTKAYLSAFKLKNVHTYELPDKRYKAMLKTIRIVLSDKLKHFIDKYGCSCAERAFGEHYGTSQRKRIMMVQYGKLKHPDDAIIKL